MFLIHYLSFRWFGGLASRHGSLHSLFQVALHLPSHVDPKHNPNSNPRSRRTPKRRGEHARSRSARLGSAPLREWGVYALASRNWEDGSHSLLADSVSIKHQPRLAHLLPGSLIRPRISSFPCGNPFERAFCEGRHGCVWQVPQYESGDCTHSPSAPGSCCDRSLDPINLNPESFSSSSLLLSSLGLSNTKSMHP